MSYAEIDLSVRGASDRSYYSSTAFSDDGSDCLDIDIELDAIESSNSSQSSESSKPQWNGKLMVGDKSYTVTPVWINADGSIAKTLPSDFNPESMLTARNQYLLMNLCEAHLAQTPNLSEKTITLVDARGVHSHCENQPLQISTHEFDLQGKTELETINGDVITYLNNEQEEDRFQPDTVLKAIDIWNEICPGDMVNKSNPFSNRTAAGHLAFAFDPDHSPFTNHSPSVQPTSPQLPPLTSSRLPSPTQPQPQQIPAHPLISAMQPQPNADGNPFQQQPATSPHQRVDTTETSHGNQQLQNAADAEEKRQRAIDAAINQLLAESRDLEANETLSAAQREERRAQIREEVRRLEECRAPLEHRTRQPSPRRTVQQYQPSALVSPSRADEISNTRQISGMNQAKAIIRDNHKLFEDLIAAESGIIPEHTKGIYSAFCRALNSNKPVEWWVPECVKDIIRRNLR